MTNKRKILIGLSIISVLGLGFWTYIAIKKKNNDGWRLIKLPDGSSKRKRKIVIIKE